MVVYCQTIEVLDSRSRTPAGVLARLSRGTENIFNYSRHCDATTDKSLKLNLTTFTDALNQLHSGQKKLLFLRTNGSFSEVMIIILPEKNLTLDCITLAVKSFVKSTEVTNYLWSIPAVCECSLIGADQQRPVLIAGAGLCLCAHLQYTQGQLLWIS